MSFLAPDEPPSASHGATGTRGRSGRRGERSPDSRVSGCLREQRSYQRAAKMAHRGGTCVRTEKAWAPHRPIGRPERERAGHRRRTETEGSFDRGKEITTICRHLGVVTIRANAASALNGRGPVPLWQGGESAGSRSVSVRPIRAFGASSFGKARFSCVYGACAVRCAVT